MHQNRTREELLDTLLKTTWATRWWFFGPRKGREVEPGVYHQKPARFMHLMLFAGLMPGFFLLVGFLTDKSSSASLGDRLMALFAAGLFLGLAGWAGYHSVGARVTEFPDRIEKRHLWRTRVIYFRDIHEIDFWQGARGVYDTALIISSTDAAGHQTKIRLTCHQWLFPLTATHSLLILAERFPPDEFRHQVGGFNVPRSELCPPDAIVYAINLNKSLWRHRRGTSPQWELKENHGNARGW